MHSRIQPLVDAAQSLNDKWTEVVTKWTNSNLPCETGYPRLHGANFNEFNKRVIATMELVRALERILGGMQKMVAKMVWKGFQQVAATATR